jgi:hypothetical protein
MLLQKGLLRANQRPCQLKSLICYHTFLDLSSFLETGRTSGIEIGRAVPHGKWSAWEMSAIAMANLPSSFPMGAAIAKPRYYNTEIRLGLRVGTEVRTAVVDGEASIRKPVKWTVNGRE